MGESLTLSKSRPLLPKTQFIALALLILLYLVVAVAHAYLAPLTTGPDELAHYEYVHFIAEHGRLPLDNTERGQASYKSDQPPLSHLITALPTALVDPSGPPFLKRVRDHIRRQLIERTRHAWGLYNTEDEQWPYQGEVLRWHVGRWVAIFFGAATVIVTFFIARDVFTGLNLSIILTNQPGWLLALGAAAVVAFIPRFTLTGSMLNYETTLAFFTALFLWVLVRIALLAPHSSLLAPRSSLLTPHSSLLALLLGLFAGLAITTKLSALILPLEMVLAFWLIRRYYGWPWKVWGKHVLIAALATLAAVSWWFGFVLYQFNTVAEDGLWVGLLRPLIAADASDATTNRLLSFLTGGQAGFTGAIDNLDSGPPWEWLAIFFRTFWVVGIEGQQPLGSFGLVVVLGLCLLAASGLITAWRQYGRRPTSAERRGQDDRRSAATARSAGSRTQDEPQVVSAVDSRADRLILSLLLLHLAMPFILPLIRYATTFSLADTAQGRHILFMAAPAFAILLVWGVCEAVSSIWYQVTGSKVVGDGVAGSRVAGNKVASFTQPAARSTQYASPNPVLSEAEGTQRPTRFMALFPGLFLLLWSIVQLWTMTWAYHPLLPVGTRSTAAAQATYQLNQPLNEFVTLLGYDHLLDHQNRVLRVDLLWQSTAISPVDYLTEVNLLDSAGVVQASWLGHPASGRYPTRAWDVGDIVRDTIWLPTGGLNSGQYTLSLNLLATTLNQLPFDQIPQTLDMPLTLGTIRLPDSTLRIFNGSLPFSGPAIAAGGYSVWQNGEPLTEPQTFRYRETVLVTLSPLLPDQQRTLRMIGPGISAEGERQSFTPVRESETAALFIVGPDWTTGDYHLQMALTTDGQAEQQGNTGSLVRVIDRWNREFNEPPLGHRLEANFANQVELLGYDLHANRADPGGGIPLTLHWQGLDWMGHDYTIFTKLLAADHTVHGGRDRLPREGYSTLYWAPGEIVVDAFGVPVDADAPDGIYYLNVGVYKPVDQQAISLLLMQDGRPIDFTSVDIGPIKIGSVSSGFTLDAVEPQVLLSQPIGDAPNLSLLGYDLQRNGESAELQAGSQPETQNSTPETLKLTLYWRSEAPLSVDYTTFVHLRNAAGEIIAQLDQPPLRGAYPTSLWDPGEIIADEIVLPLPDALPESGYKIVVGLYDLQTGQRLAVPGNAANEVELVAVN